MYLFKAGVAYIKYGVVLLMVALMVSCSLSSSTPNKKRKDIEKVGIVCSLTGPAAISESSVKDAALMAIEEINDDGGLLGKKIEPIWVDAESNDYSNMSRTLELLNSNKVSAIFGAWTAKSIQLIAPFLKLNQTLLFNISPYEKDFGIDNMVFLGAAPNQQLLPAAAYLIKLAPKKYNRFYLLGTDNSYSHEANRILKQYLIQNNIPSSNINEKYVPRSIEDYQQVVVDIKRFSVGGRICVINTIEGKANIGFYKEFANQGLSAAYCPIMSLTMSEEEFRQLDTEFFTGHLVAKNYLQSQDTDKNIRFVSNFKLYCAIKELPDGVDRVTNDNICWVYTGIQLWKKAVEKAGSFESEKLKKALKGLEVNSPAGIVKIESDRLWMEKKVLIGESNTDGQFSIAWQSDSLIKPDFKIN